MRVLILTLLIVLTAGAFSSSADLYVPARLAGPSYPDDGILKEILAEVKALRRELAVIRREQQAVRAPDNLKQLIASRCASCHGEQVADSKGAGFLMLQKNGDVPPFSLAEKKRIIRLVERGEMPKDGQPFSEAEKDALKKFLSVEVIP